MRIAPQIFIERLQVPIYHLIQTYCDCLHQVVTLWTLIERDAIQAVLEVKFDYWVVLCPLIWIWMEEYLYRRRAALQWPWSALDQRWQHAFSCRCCVQVLLLTGTLNPNGTYFLCGHWSPRTITLATAFRLLQSLLKAHMKWREFPFLAHHLQDNSFKMHSKLIRRS